MPQVCITLIGSRSDNPIVVESSSAGHKQGLLHGVLGSLLALGGVGGGCVHHGRFQVADVGARGGSVDEPSWMLFTGILHSLHHIMPLKC